MDKKGLVVGRVVLPAQQVRHSFPAPLRPFHVVTEEEVAEFLYQSVATGKRGASGIPWKEATGQVRTFYRKLARAAILKLCPAR